MLELPEGRADEVKFSRDVICTWQQWWMTQELPWQVLLLQYRARDGKRGYKNTGPRTPGLKARTKICGDSRMAPSISTTCTRVTFGYLTQQNWCIFNSNSISSHILGRSVNSSPVTAKVWQSSYPELNFRTKIHDIQLSCISHPN